MKIKHPEWRASHEPTKYPFSHTASLVNDAGDVLFETMFIDASFYVIGATTQLYLSRVRVTPDEITLFVGDDVEAALASVTFDAAAPPDDLRFVDSYGRPAGLVVSESIRLAIFSSWTPGDHDFTPEQTAFVARCCHAIPATGFRGFELDDGNILTGDVWLVGDDGIVLTCEESTEPVPCSADPQTITTLRVDVVGDSLFRRKLCSQPDAFETPRFLQTITFCTPGNLESSSLSSSVSTYVSESSLNPLPEAIDVLFLCDTTASMLPAITAVQSLFATVAAGVGAALPTVDFNWAAAEYRDILMGDPFDDIANGAYRVNQAFTDDEALVQTAIEGWEVATPHPDPPNPEFPEQNLLTLVNISRDWEVEGKLAGRDVRPRVVVMIGDAWGRRGGDFPDTTAEVGVAMAAAGIKYIGCSTGPSGQALDGEGQATALAAATGGVVIYNALSYTVENLTELLVDAIVDVSSTTSVTRSVTTLTNVVFDASESRCVKCGPGEYGDVKIFVHTEASPDTILRVRPVPEGLKIEAIGERLENLR